jgi:cellulose synthase/poly-beta-1,6-N-acetylglucosamine synthase-like glycosyltransferase
MLDSDKQAGATPYPLVSILIPAKNQERVIERCMQSLTSLDYPKDRLEVIVVDGCSKDNTAEIAQKYGAKVVYDDGKGRCRAHGLNAGIVHARGHYIAFTDPDCSVEPEWLTRALPYFRASKVGGVGGHCFAPQDASPLAEATNFVAYLTVSTLPKQPGAVPFIAGANSVYRAEAIKPLFPIPEVVAGEDAVLSLKARDAKWQLIFAPEVVVWHNMHYTNLLGLFRQMQLYGTGSAQCWRLDRRLVGPQSWLKALVPLLLGPLAIALLLKNRGAFLGALSLGILMAFWLSGRLFWKARSLRAALVLPLVGTTMATAYSMGFLKEFAASSVKL